MAELTQPGKLDKKVLKKVYFNSILWGSIIAFWIMFITAILRDPESNADIGSKISFWLKGSLFLVILLSIIPSLLNLLFFKIREGKMYFLTIPIFILVVLYGAFGVLTYKPDDSFFIAPLSVLISQTVTGIWGYRKLKKSIPIR